jgi:hypothetical protein
MIVNFQACGFCSRGGLLCETNSLLDLFSNGVRSGSALENLLNSKERGHECKEKSYEFDIPPLRSLKARNWRRINRKGLCAEERRTVHIPFNSTVCVHSENDL